MKSLVLTLITLISFTVNSQIEFTEESVYSSPLMYSNLEMKITGTDTTYKWKNRNLTYSVGSHVVTTTLSFTEQQLKELTDVMIDVIDNDKKVMFMGYTIERGPAKSIYLHTGNGKIQIIKKHVHKANQSVS